MEILFSAKISKNGTKVRVLLLCPDCREELEMAKDLATVRFRCGKHGELGTLTFGEFSEGLQQARKPSPNSTVWANWFESTSRQAIRKWSTKAVAE